MHYDNYCVSANHADFCFHCAIATCKLCISKAYWTQRRTPQAWKSNEWSYLFSEGHITFCWVDQERLVAVDIKQSGSDWKYWAKWLSLCLIETFLQLTALKTGRAIFLFCICKSRDKKKRLIKPKAKRQSCPCSSVRDRREERQRESKLNERISELKFKNKRCIEWRTIS